MYSPPEFTKNKVGQCDPQEVFNYITGFLLKQGKKSLKAQGGCMYRGMAGCMCAIGCIIPDDMYDPAIESTTLNSALGTRLRQIINNLGHKYNERLLDGLQGVHDCSRVEYWKEELQEVAEKHNLEFNPTTL